MNTVVTSREAILTVCKKLAEKEGLASINIRAVAKACNVSVGSIYNYFPSKAELISAMTQEVWQDIFHLDETFAKRTSFSELICCLFKNAREGAAKYPDFFFAHSMRFTGAEKGKGRSVMERYMAHMKQDFLTVLQKDSAVAPNAFSNRFSQEEFIDFVFTNLLALLAEQANDCSVFIEIIKRTIYQ